MKIIYEIRELNIIIAEDKTIWKLPFNSGIRYYSIKQLEFKIHQGLLKLRVNNKRYSKTVLYDMLTKVDYEYRLPTEIDDCPF